MEQSWNRCTASISERGVGRLKIAASGPMNLLGTPVIDDLRAALARLQSVEALRTLILCGDGDRAFVGGADIKEMARLDQDGAERFITNLHDLCEQVRRFPVPFIARIPGWCLGGGLELAMACDIRIAADEANFAMPEVRVGIPSVIHAALMPRLLGVSRANWLILTGETIDAATALAWGLLNKVVSLAQLDAEIDKVVEGFLACGPQALRSQKALLRSWEELPLQQGLHHSIATFGQAFTTGEPQKMMQAFLDRPRPGR
ncbi:MAG: enoyl-CoA hydratase/isomerase family protein [Burkholderiales bacterium]|nr:enoyl-CoA hydratase/isomerase family protein [Burkholderiales bacterium]